MFEILSALRDLNEACMKNDTSLRWHIEHRPGDVPVLRAEIPLDDNDVQFTNDMQALFAPVDD